MNRIIQNDNINLIHTKKTVDWLVNNTVVSVFNPISFTGYQRQIDSSHCDKIVDYLMNDFFLPTSIICALDERFEENRQLRIVDGQHRVKAFEMIKNKHSDRYLLIKDFELSVIVLELAKEKVEIDTFITINKTSKKVDTSLAYVLKNKLNKNYSSGDLNITRRDYLSVELAYNLNTYNEKGLWFDKILFEGNPKKNPQFISLNAFVKSTRSLLLLFEKLNLIKIEWNNTDDLLSILNTLEELFEIIWVNVYKKWPDFLYIDINQRKIIQGAIGFNSINRYIIENLKDSFNVKNKNYFDLEIKKLFSSITIPFEYWLPGGKFSNFSSESGYRIIVEEIKNSSY